MPGGGINRFLPDEQYQAAVGANNPSETNVFITTNDLATFTGTTNLSVGNITANTLDIISDTGNDATIPSATTTQAGLQSASDKSKLNSIEAGAEVNVQADWNQTDNTSDDFIKNKPTIPSNSGVYGTERNYSESLGNSLNTTNNFQNKINFNTTALVSTRTYRLDWACETNADVNYRRVEIEVSIGGNIIALCSSETETNPDYQDRAGFIEFTGISGIQNVLLRYRPVGTANPDANIRRAKISIIRTL